MQDALFPDDEPPAPARRAALSARAVKKESPPHSTRVLAQPPTPQNIELAAALPRLAHLGTSSRTFPGWNGLVQDGDYSDTQLSKYGLAAYAQHPLFRTVSLDRAFYRPLSTQQYAGLAARVGDDFRFSVKAPRW